MKTMVWELSSLDVYQMEKQTIIAAGESREMVLLNAPSQDLHFVQETGSHLRLHVLNLYSAIGQPSPEEPVANRIFVEQQGTGCLTEIYGLACLKGTEQVSTATHIHHNVGGGESRQLIKFVLDGTAKGEFFGELKIAPGVQKTEAHQTNRNLLLSDTAVMRTRPQLEIYADDVKATHGASTGQLDESALFYMQQRCLSQQTARRLLIGAFMKDVLETISDETQREQLMQAIDGVVE